MTETLNYTPEALYRGIVVPASEFSEELLTKDLTPGSAPKVDELGRQTVNDGNEYGVYMTDEPSMAKAAYGTPHTGEILPGSPSFGYRGVGGRKIEVPRIGVIYKINTDGLQVKRPFIKDSLKGVYNNGFQGNEWIADRVPAENYQVTGLTVGPDTLHNMPRHFEVGDDPELAIGAMREELSHRMGALAIALEIISNMPPERRQNSVLVNQALADVLA